MQIRSAKARYADILTAPCPRCGSFAHLECVDGTSGKARRTPHMARVEAFYEQPRSSRPQASLPPVAAPAKTKVVRPIPKPRQVPAPSSNGVHGLFATIAEAFGAR